MIKYEVSDINRNLKLQNIKYPTSIYLKITTECMLKCNFCSQSNSENEFMKLRDIKNVLCKLKNMGGIYIYYTGGEPLMHKDIKEVLKYGYNLGFKQFLVTNGILFSKKENRDLIKYIIGLGVSIHGKSLIHNEAVGNINCYDAIIRNLKLVKKENQDINININCTSTDYNSNEENLKYLAELCKDNEWNLSIARLNYIGAGIKYQKTNLNNMLDIVRKLNDDGYNIKISNCIAPCTIDEKNIFLTHGCGAGQTIAAIEANGDVKICASSTKTIGNIYQNSFKKIWNSNKMRKYRKMNWVSSECKVCKYFLMCKGGCKAELSGEYWKEMCDATVENINKIEWEIIKNRPISLAFEFIRRNGREYIIIGCKIRLCNGYTKKILHQIDGKRTGNDIINLVKNNKEKAKQLLIIMKKENLIEIK
ncbi:MAG: radical SAM protein [Clostridia bacterium]|nr:radical SAM protein [Clostridia bacterium]